MEVSEVVHGIGAAQLDTLVTKEVPAWLCLLSWLMLGDSSMLHVVDFVETPSWEMSRRMLWVWWIWKLFNKFQKNEMVQKRKRLLCMFTNYFKWCQFMNVNLRFVKQCSYKGKIYAYSDGLVVNKSKPQEWTTCRQYSPLILYTIDWFFFNIFPSFGPYFFIHGKRNLNLHCIVIYIYLYECFRALFRENWPPIIFISFRGGFSDCYLRIANVFYLTRFDSPLPC